MQEREFTLLESVIVFGLMCTFIGLVIVYFKPIDHFAKTRDIVRKDLMHRFSVVAGGCYFHNNALGSPSYTQPIDCTDFDELLEKKFLKNDDFKEQLDDFWSCSPGCFAVQLERPDNPSLPFLKFDSNVQNAPTAEGCGGYCQ